MGLDFLYKDYEGRLSSFQKKGLLLVHYTTFEALSGILSTQSLWLRNARDMSDVYELEYGKGLVSRWALERSDLLKQLSNVVGLDLNVLLSFGNHAYWATVFRDIYISSFGEFDLDRDAHGRVDMWERYARENGVALVLNPSFLSNDDQVHGLNPLPVRYWTYEDLKRFLDDIAGSFSAHIASFSPSELQEELPFNLAMLVASIKRPEYRAEQEWRLVSSDVLEGASPFVTASGDGRIRVADLSERSASRYRLGSVLQKIIVGPTQGQSTLHSQVLSCITAAQLSVPVKLSEIGFRN